MGGGEALPPTLCTDHWLDVPKSINEHVLPSVTLVKAVAVFDEAVEDYIDRNHGGLPSAYRATLDARIRFLVDRALVANGPQLHLVRALRNPVAHGRDGDSTWKELEIALGELESALIALNVVQARPQLEILRGAFWNNPQ
jgi:hypothetical protein